MLLAIIGGALQQCYNPRGVLPIMAYTGRLRPKGVSFQASGMWKGREICHLGLWKGPKGRTDEFYGFIKSRKRSSFKIDSYSNDSKVLNKVCVRGTICY